VDDLAAGLATTRCALAVCLPWALAAQTLPDKAIASTPSSHHHEPRLDDLLRTANHPGKPKLAARVTDKIKQIKNLQAVFQALFRA